MLFFAKADTCVRQLQMYELISFTRQGFASLFFFNGMFRLISQPRFALKPQPHRRRLSFCTFGDIKTKKSSKTKSFSKILHDLSKVFTNFVLNFFENTSRCTSTAKSAGFETICKRKPISHFMQKQWHHHARKSLVRGK